MLVGVQTPPTFQEVRAHLALVHEANRESAALRRRLRRRTTPGAEQREEAIEQMFCRLRILSAPLRRWIGMLLWHDFAPSQETALREAIYRTRAERRALGKMRR